MIAGQPMQKDRSPLGESENYSPDEQTVEVFRIHGTFASNDDDDGAAWWQRGSDFQKDLESQLLNGACSDVIFHWTGENSAKARARAGMRLFNDVLRSREESGRRYALIGHSHGGAVIQEALVEGFRRGCKLDCLVAVISIGTPFLRSRWRISSMLQLVPFGIGVTGLLTTLPSIRAAFAYRSAVLDGGDAMGALLATLFWVLLGIATLALTYAVVQSIRPLLTGSWRIERRMRHALMHRWIPIASSSDEAILALAGATRAQHNLFPDLPYVVPNSKSPWWIWLVSVPVLPMLAAMSALVGFYNLIAKPYFLSPLFNQLIRRRAFGDDVPGVDTVAVDAEFSPNGVRPRDIGVVVELADARMAEMIPTLRKDVLSRFQRAGAGVIPDVFGSLGSLTEGLVHCAYFLDKEVVGKIASVLNRSSGQSDSADILLESESGTRKTAAPGGTGARVIATALTTGIIVGLVFLLGVLDRAFIDPHTPEYNKALIFREHPRLDPVAIGSPMEPVVAWLEMAIVAGEFDVVLQELRGITYIRERVLRSTLPLLAEYGGLELLDRVASAVDFSTLR